MEIDAIHYRLGSSPVTGLGVGILKKSINEMINGPISSIVFDLEGNKAIEDLLNGVTETQFSKARIKSILSQNNQPEGWRVGEAIAELYYSENKKCTFPWPNSRDVKKRNSSLPGADLVGFHETSDMYRFAFGEVKTSFEENYPPGVMHGRHGLKRQIEDLLDKSEIRDDLVKYLGHHAVNSDWKNLYIQAASTYLNDSTNVFIFGALIRDVKPDEADLKARVNSLSEECPTSTTVDLIAIYLPLEIIPDLGKMVMKSSNDKSEE